MGPLWTGLVGSETNTSTWSVLIPPQSSYLLRVGSVVRSPSKPGTSPVLLQVLKNRAAPQNMDSTSCWTLQDSVELQVQGTSKGNGPDPFTPAEVKGHSGQKHKPTAVPEVSGQIVEVLVPLGLLQAELTEPSGGENN